MLIINFEDLRGGGELKLDLHKKKKNPVCNPVYGHDPVLCGGQWSPSARISLTDDISFNQDMLS